MTNSEGNRETGVASVSDEVSVEDGVENETTDEPVVSRIIYHDKNGVIESQGEQGNIAASVPDLHVTAEQEPASKPSQEKDYSSFTLWEKRFIVLTATMGAFFSPFSAQIYFPALNRIAKDLNVSSSKINLTMTTYMVRLNVHSFFYQY